jgi:hypothetical protein
MMEKFTPGPWNWESQNGRVLSRHKRKGTTGGCTHNSIYAICNLDDGEYIVYEDEAELEANARLIVTAPEMYALLKKHQAECGGSSNYGSCSACRDRESCELTNLLARINGEESK